MNSTPSGIVRFLRFGQSLNTFGPTNLSDFGRTTSSRFVHPQNVFALSLSTPSGIVTGRLNSLHSLYIPSIFKTLFPRNVTSELNCSELKNR